MGKWRKGQKYFLSIALAAAIMLTEMPLTALAAPETGITAEAEAESAQAQTGEGAEQEQQTQEEDKEESASQTGDDASQEQPAQNGEGGGVRQRKIHP